GSLPSLRDLAGELERLGADPGPLSPDLVARAAGRARDLVASTAETVLLHGDLHHGNVLRSGREGWLAVDPKGFVGDPAFEPGALIRNPGERLDGLTEAGLVGLLEERAALLSDALGLDPGRVLGWTFVQSVLAACWQVEDHDGGWEPAVRLARVLEAVDAGADGAGG
ncbi:MAG: aminoglycoside phosphotransferase family protein, partial [Gemmatimonadota bacterium]